MRPARAVFEEIRFRREALAGRRMDHKTWQIICFTLGVSVLSTLLILPCGVALAWLLARPKWMGKSLVETLVALPLVIPPVATGLILLKLLGRRGILGSFIEKTLALK